MGFHEFLFAEEVDPGAVALVDPAGESWSYGQLHSAVSHLSGFIADQSEIGDRCALFASNSFFWVAAYLAVIRAGRIVVPIPPGADANRLRTILLNCAPTLAFADGARAALLHEQEGRSMLLVTAEESDLPRVVEFDEALAMLPMDGIASIGVDAPAAIFHTSGTTSDPRGVVLTHGNLAATTTNVEELLQLTSCDRGFLLPPLASVFAAATLHAHLRAGASVVLEHWPIAAEHLPERLRALDCSGITGTSEAFEAMLVSEALAGAHYPHLRYLQHVGGRPRSAQVQQLRAAYPAQHIHLVYGLAEAGGHVATIPPEQLARVAGLVGKPLPGFELSIIDARGRLLPAGETGEVALRGPCVSRGYWRNTAASCHTFREGTLRTGDVGTMDSDANLYITGRTQDVLDLGRQNIPIAHIEQVVSAFPGVIEVAATSRQDELVGEAVVLFVAHIRGRAAMKNLVDYCAAKLPFGQRPREIHFRARLPHDASGALDRLRLQDDLQAQQPLPIFLDRMQSEGGALQA